MRYRRKLMWIRSAGKMLVWAAVACGLSLPGAAGEQNPPAGGQATRNSGSKDRKAGKADEKGGNAGDEAFSEQVSDQVLRDIADGLEAHNSRLLLSAFDARKMAGYRVFRDQIDALFEKYEGFRVHYNVTQTAQEGGRGIVLADWEMEEIAADGVTPPLLRRGQIRFVLEPGSKGWKVVDLQPRGMFSE